MATEASAPHRKLSAILMVDVSDFSRMMGRDEEGTTARIREFHASTRSLVEGHEGWVVDTAGGSVFGEFDSVLNAVRCAQAIQHAQATANATRPDGERIETRIGVHLGDVLVQDYHVYGDGVNIAARLQAVADPGSICVSEAVYQQVYQKLDLAFEDLGIQELKNIEYPIRLYRVVGQGHDRPAGPPAEPPRGPHTTAPKPPVPRSDSWREAFLHPGSLVPLLVGLSLLANSLGLFPSVKVGISPTVGAVLCGVGLGRIWARRTGRRGPFLIALGAGIMLGGVLMRWSGVASSGLILGGVITAACGVIRLFAPQAHASREHGRQAREKSRL
jgi:class 3 adenylate cyclase